MAFRNIIIESPARISTKNAQLVISTESEHSVPIEDISSILIENQRSTITAAALSRLGQGGCAVYVCDEKHIPCAVLTPYGRNSRGYGMIKLQLSATTTLKKRLWQQIVSCKIQNQARCLQMGGVTETSRTLSAMADNVGSGDPKNIEAVAAQQYFPALYGEGFTRDSEVSINSALNYGYAILRGCVARNLAVYGFLPSLGLHHHNEMNNFNLADDLMEPFRPVVDLLVARMPLPQDSLTPECKRLLFNILNLDVQVAN